MDVNYTEIHTVKYLFEWFYELKHTDLDTKPTDPGLYSLHWIMLSMVPAVSPILKAPAWTPPTVAGPMMTYIYHEITLQT